MSADVRHQIARFDPDVPIERAWMPPSSWYVSDAIAAHERRAVFSRRFLPVARAEELEAPGSVRAGCVAGEPWLIARGGDGVLRAFHNTCRHKGNLVVGDETTAEELVCGYHGWTYALDGRLLRAPRVAGIESFDRDAMSLAPLALAQWGPWLFVCGDASARWPGLEPLSSQLDATGWTDLVYAGRRSWDLACNWKVYVDNYLDGGYHIGHIHPSLEAQLDGGHYATTLAARHSVQTVPPSEAGGARIGAGAIYAFVYPNLMVNRYGACLEGNFVTPLAVDRCRVDYDFFFERGTPPADIAASIEESAVIQREDVSVSEAVQVGLASSGFDRGRYAPRVERAEHHFHCLLARDLADPIPGS